MFNDPKLLVPEILGSITEDSKGIIKMVPSRGSKLSHSFIYEFYS